jgi:hypothetical protein
MKTARFFFKKRALYKSPDSGEMARALRPVYSDAAMTVVLDSL